MDTLPLTPEYCWLTGTTEVNVQDPDLQVMDRGQTLDEVDRHRALAHPALAGQHQHLVLDS